MRVGALLTAIVAAVALPLEAAWAQTAPTVTSTLPAWRAPGAPLSVRGTAAPGAEVELRLGAARRATVVAEPDGGFVFRIRTPSRPNRYSVAVASGGERTRAGSLRVRPIRLAAGGDVTLGDGVATAIRAHGKRWPWRSVAPVLRAADVAVVNLETCVSTRGRPWPGKEFGAHPHVLQPRDRRGSRFVAWSLGNFVFAWNSPGTNRTGILRLGLGRTGVVSSRFLPARINRVQPRLR
jgi:Bacterial capsule synthesis protein PGA_cap